LVVLRPNDHAPAAVGVTETTNDVLALAATLAAGWVMNVTVQFSRLVAMVALVTDNVAVPLLLSAYVRVVATPTVDPDTISEPPFVTATLARVTSNSGAGAAVALPDTVQL